MKYILDTNIVSYSINRRSPFHHNVIKQLSCLSEQDTVFISVLTLYETEYGLLSVPREHKPRVSKAQKLMLHLFEILSVPVTGAKIFGRIKMAYRNKTGISQKSLDQHNVDFIIAGSAIAEDAILVSNDKIFMAIREIEPTLKLKNWAL
jgi:predicted nucleic acid-binding protein